MARIELSLPRLRILDRYLIREFLIGYGIAVGVVLGLRVTLDLFAQFDEFVEQGEGTGSETVSRVLMSILSYYGPRLFEYFRDFSGMIIMAAAAFSLVRMKRDNEFVAILASGVSLKRVMAPILAMGLVFNGLMIADQELLLPRIADRLALEIDDVNGIRSMPLPLLNDGDDYVFTAELFEAEYQRLVNLYVIMRLDGDYAGEILAPQAVWVSQDEENDEGYWSLHEGVQIIEGKSHELTRFPTTLSPRRLLLQRHSNFKSLLDSRQLRQLLNEGDLRQSDYQVTLNELYFRFTDPIINMLMLLLALPLLVSRDLRGQGRSSLLLALAGPVSCFVFTFACKLMVVEWWDPMLAAWLPIIVFSPLALLALDNLKT